MIVHCQYNDLCLCNLCVFPQECTLIQVLDRSKDDVSERTSRPGTPGVVGTLNGERMWEGISLKQENDKRLNKKDGILMVHSGCFLWLRICFFGLLLLLFLCCVSVQRVHGNS